MYCLIFYLKNFAFIQIAPELLIAHNLLYLRTNLKRIKSNL